MNTPARFTQADIAALVTERETRLTAIIERYGLQPINAAPLLTATARDIAVALDKIERKCS